MIMNVGPFPTGTLQYLPSSYMYGPINCPIDIITEQLQVQLNSPPLPAPSIAVGIDHGSSLCFGPQNRECLC